MEGYRIFSLIFCIEAFINIGFLIVTVQGAGFKYAWNVYIPMPKDIKDNTEMNWFGCIVCYIGLFILLPIWYICKLVYWLFHI